MFKRLALLTLGLFLSCSIIARPHPKPEQCPNINVVKSEGLITAEEIFGDNFYGALNFSNYGLKEKWAFVIAAIEANNKKQALEIGQKLLKQTSGSPVPTLDDKETWVCWYQAPGDYIAVAIEPLDDSFSIMTLSRHLHRR